MCPNYGWQGPGQTRQMTHERAEAPTVTAPSSPDIEGPDESATKFIRCDVPDCGRKFRKAMIAARHFNASHESLRKDKDSWREHTTEIHE